ncbi:hypothetical protein [Corynebacterium pilosum]|nr:hypothetical protein [Corynebacterium pilosum]
MRWLGALADQVQLFLFTELMIAVPGSGERWPVLADAKRALI